jgi:hypothetical protein
MRYVLIHTLLLMSVFCSSCGGKNKSAPPNEKIKSEIKDVSTSRWIDTKYEYTNSIGKGLVIQNSLPRGEKYTHPNGKEYFKAIFWTRIINEADNPLELKIDFPVESYEIPWLPGKYFKVLVPPDTMTIDKEPLYNYGLTSLKSFLDNSIDKPSSLKRTINPKESSGFYVVILSLRAEEARGVLRTGLSLNGQNLFYRISLYASTAGLPLISEKEVHCGRINLKNLMLQK